MLLERIHFTRYSASPGHLPVLDAYELLIWFPCVFVFAFLLLDKKHALFFNRALVGGSLLILRDWVTPGADRIYHADLTEFYIGQVSCIVALYGFSMLRDRFLSTHDRAVHLRNFAETDFLTGIPNRRVLAQSLEREILRCQRYGRTLSVLLLDLDHFKQVNDTHGHDAGDRALRRVAHLIDRARRQTDVFGRWGGEEFLLIAPNLDVDDARAGAERLRGQIVSANRFANPPVTASFGVSEYRLGDDVASLVKRADEALMDAKRSGRDRVVACTA